MNREMYNDCLAKVKNFEKIYVRDVDTDKIVLDDKLSQIRVKGAVAQKVPAMVSDIETNGQEVPSCVKCLPNGKYELKDGITRYLAQKERKNRLRVSTYHDSLFSSEDQWLFHQSSCNDHDTSTPNTREDIKYQVAKAIKTGALERKLGYKYLGNEKKFMKEAPKFLKEQVYRRSVLSKDSIKTIVKNCLSSTIVQSRYENYTKNTALEFFSSHNNHNWAGTQSGEICNNYCIYPIGSTDDEGMLYGNAWRKTIKTLTSWFVLLHGSIVYQIKTTKALKARQRLYDIYKKGQNHPRFQGSMFSKFYLIPQIKTGSNKENMYKLYSPHELGLT